MYNLNKVYQNFRKIPPNFKKNRKTEKFDFCHEK